MLEGRAGLSRMAVWPGATCMSRACWFTNVRALVAPIHLPLAQRQPGTEVPDDQPGNPCKATRCPHHRAQRAVQMASAIFRSGVCAGAEDASHWSGRRGLGTSLLP